MFSRQYYMAPSVKKVFGSSGCAASRRLCSDIVPPSPGCPFSFSSLLLCVCPCFFRSIFFSLKFSWVCICFHFSFFLAMGQGFPLGVAIWGRGFFFSLGPIHGKMQWIFSKFSLFPKEGGNIARGSCVEGGTLPSHA